MNRLAACRGQESARLTREPEKTKRDIKRLIDAIKTGVPGEAIREPIEEVRLVPDNGNLRIEFFGELAALIRRANEHPRGDDPGVQVTLVAGAGFEPATFRL